MRLLAGTVVVLAGLFLLALAGTIAIHPSRAERFLRSFASSARAHYSEQGLRLAAGAAIVFYAPATWYPRPFRIFGWILVVSAVGLLLIPWRWHHEFAKWAIPLAIRQLGLLALGAFLLGTLVLYGVFRPMLS